MPLPVPDLDDRDFRDLLAAAHRRIDATCPEWTDRTASEPGMALVDVFAYLTDVLLYRLNRLPDKAHIAFLDLIGVRLRPPTAAAATLRASRTTDDDRTVEIPVGLRVTTGPGGGRPAPVFTVVTPGVLEAGQPSVDVLARHCQLVEGEVLGHGTGRPGLSLTVAHVPIVAGSPGDPSDLLVGVEAGPDELAPTVRAREHGGRAYVLWEEVGSFAGLDPGSRAYVADRATGTVTFAPALDLAGDADGPAPALARVPAEGRAVCAWYGHGGGPEGNVAAGVLTTLKDPLPGLAVTNPAPAVGGRALEALEHAVRRGPLTLHGLERAVTARDHEAVALAASGAVARARAFTRAEVRPYARAGSVEVVLVPDVPGAPAGGRLDRDALAAHESDEAVARVRDELDRRRPLGTELVVSWARVKAVSVRARVVVRREEDRAAVRRRVLDRLHATVSPLPTDQVPHGWDFGRPVRSSDVYAAALAEPGVSHVDGVRLLVDEVPGADVAALAADPHQASTWYAAAGRTVYRSENDARGWEAVGRMPGRVAVVAPHPQPPRRPGVPSRPGWVAAVVDDGDGGSTVTVSEDLGETWRVLARTGFQIDDVAWLARDGEPLLVLASEAGVHELRTTGGAVPVPVLVDPGQPDRGFLAVASWVTVRGEVGVAAAARGTAGVFVSEEGGRTGTFRPVGLEGRLLRPLAVQYGPAGEHLLAGEVVSGDDPGRGCSRWSTAGAGRGWEPVAQGWRGGTCWSIDVVGGTVLAGSHSAGVLRAESGGDEPVWARPEAGSGLPLHDGERFLFHPVRAVAADGDSGVVLAGGPHGVQRSQGGAGRWAPASERAFAEAVTVPPTWLACSGDHDVEVVSDGAARGDR